VKETNTSHIKEQYSRSSRKKNTVKFKVFNKIARVKFDLSGTEKRN